ncbi:MAG: hypothetical protein LBI77_03400 [Puniceicoccales bacterium]|nr:hypothetical protein [Puniceicoccales bacterium]
MNARLRQLWIGKIDGLCQVENWKYAQFLCLELLHEEPNFVDARRILHNIRQYTFCRKKIRRWILLSVVFFRVIWYALRIKSRHRQLLNATDELLNIDPNNVMILRLFAEIMSCFGFLETVIFSIECIPENKRNGDDWLLMGEAFLDLENFQMAVNVAKKILTKSPHNMQASDLLQKSSIEQSMRG